MSEAAGPALPVELLRAENLPTMPHVAVRVLQLTQDEDATLDDLAAVLAMDPALAAKLLKLANSSLFGLGAEVTTLQRACMVLGLKTVKLMSLSFSLVTSLRGKTSPAPFDFEQYWRRSVVSAVAGRSLAKELGSMLEDEAFLCGLLSRLGQLAMAVCVPGAYAEVCEEAGADWPAFELEERKLGFDGRDVAAALLRSWELPELIAATAAAMHAPGELPPRVAPETRELTSIMHVSALCEELLCGRDPGGAKRALDGAAAALYQLTSADVDGFVLGLEAQVDETAEMLSIDVESVDVQQVLSRAQAHLVRIGLGVATEMRRVEERATRLEWSNRELRSQARTDKLTSLANRASFDEILQSCVMERLRTRQPHALGLLMIDVDRFKSFNDTHGHLVGDAVLELVGRTLRDATRATDLPARYGGEEFAVILPRTTPIGMKSLAERIRASIEAAALESGGRILSVTASIGGACVDELHDEKGGATLVEIADHYLYKAKENGRNRCEFFPGTTLPATG